MYKRTITVQKNPTKLFENGLIRFREVRGLYLPLGFMVERKVEDEYTKKPEKKIFVNDNIASCRIHTVGPGQLGGAGSGIKVRAIEEWSEEIVGTDAFFDPNSLQHNRSEKDSNCFTYFAIAFDFRNPKGKDHVPVSSLELEVSGRQMVEDLLKTIPADGSCYPVPVHKSLVDITVTGREPGTVERASEIIYQHFEKLQSER